MIPLVQEMSAAMDVEPVIWALVLGADFGGNATVVGASANVVVASMSESRGHPISFIRYLRYGIPAALLTLAVAAVDIWLRTTVFA
jgi:Na+/H+ antiporter NhaD/arsenite permease-like protein